MLTIVENQSRRLEAVIIALLLITPLMPQANAADLTVARPFDAASLDPQRVGATYSLQITNLIFDTLLTMDKDGSVHPGLASDWTMADDGKTYSFTIRDGIRCHDGSAFDADAAKASLERALDPSTLNPNLTLWGPITGTAVDGNRLMVSFSERYGPFTAFLTSMQAAFLCPSSFSAKEFKPIGTGPFKFASWTRNDSIQLEANPEYKNSNPLVQNAGKPHIDKLTFKVIPEAVARMAALRSGEADMVEPSLQEAIDLKGDSDFKVYASELSGQQMFASYTWKIKPLDDPSIRKAIGMAMNREAYAAIAFEGLVKTASCPVAPNLFATDQTLCATWGAKYDPEGAKAVLAAKGYTPDEPLKVKLVVYKGEGWDRMHEIMQQDLAAVGVQAEIETWDVAAFYGHMSDVNARTDGPPAILTMGMSGVDPDYLYFLWRRPGASNLGLNAELDVMLEEQRKLSGEPRADKIHDIQEYLLTNTYAVPLISPGWGWLMASTAKVNDFKMGFMVSLLFNDVTVSE
ncbi:ABC transporter substrate-binding protein [Rhizobium laguerreae]|uniref:ABC transporter substrate-binding protein n=1 Tax=Rhizobium laguerreae TaxID=1076926 RepID=UPI001C91632A|nr:ABC transporter substrate-binding protein [Rhizobium laguerreae]MBY3537568.1 ABC transporter substrate-binding protein [Rhizobium laguerreae]